MVRPLDEGTVQEIRQLLLEGKSCRIISAALNVSKSSVEKKRKFVPNLPPECPRGRKKLLNPAIERRILRDLGQQKVENAVQIQKQLKNTDGIDVSVQTVRNTLKSAGLRGRAKIKKPLLTKRHMRLRLDFAKKYQHWSEEDWEQVLWSDETKINRFGSDGRVWTWRKPGSNVEPRNVLPTVKFGGGSIMIWGCMMAGGVGTVHKIEGIMTAQSYINILSQNIPASVEKLNFSPENFIFQHDNDPKHKAKITTNWLNEQNYKVLDWPPQSPDLNPIEHLWGVLKRGVSDNPSNLEQLWGSVGRAWNNINQETCKNLVDSMPRRIHAVLHAKGGYTKY